MYFPANKYNIPHIAHGSRRFREYQEVIAVGVTEKIAAGWHNR